MGKDGTEWTLRDRMGRNGVRIDGERRWDFEGRDMIWCNTVKFNAIDGDRME